MSHNLKLNLTKWLLQISFNFCGYISKPTHIFLHLSTQQILKLSIKQHATFLTLCVLRGAWPYMGSSRLQPVQDHFCQYCCNRLHFCGTKQWLQPVDNIKNTIVYILRDMSSQILFKFHVTPNHINSLIIYHVVPKTIVISSTKHSRICLCFTHSKSTGTSDFLQPAGLVVFRTCAL